MFLGLRFTVLATALFSSYFARSSSSIGTSTSGAITTHTVAVGAVGFNFTPNQLHANVGDIIEYRFYPQNHSVARAAFTQPCIPYEDTGPNRVGFWSGFQPVALVLSNPPIFQLAINDSEPMFFYCSTPGACFAGMVGVINPNATWTFSAQFGYSQNATEAFGPLEYFPQETLNPLRGTTTSSAKPSSTFNSPTASSSPQEVLSTGGTVEIVIGSLTLLISAGVLIFIHRRQKKPEEILQRSETPLQVEHRVAPRSRTNEVDHFKTPQEGSATRSITNFREHRQFNAQGAYGSRRAEEESRNSISPPIDEQSVMHPTENVWNLRNVKPSQAVNSWHNANSFGSSSSTGTEMPQREDIIESGIYDPVESPGPHEMPITSPSPLRLPER